MPDRGVWKCLGHGAPTVVFVSGRIAPGRPFVRWLRDPPVSRFGMMRLLATDPGPPLAAWSAEEWDILARLRRQRNLALADAHVGPERATADLVRAAGGLADMPLIVLTQGRGIGGWSDLQRQLAERSRRGRQVLVPNSGQGVPMEAPGAIVSAVRELVAPVNAARGS